MAKIIDYISATIICFLLTFAWTIVAFDNLTAAITVSSAFTLIAVVSIRFVKKSGKPYSYDRLALEFAIRGNKYVIDLIKNSLGTTDISSENIGTNFILFDGGIIISAFKFNSLNISDVCAICNLAAEKGKKDVYVLCRGIERRAYNVARLENMRLTPIKIRAIYKFLKAQNALPNLKEIKQKPSLKAFFAAIFNRGNLKGYMFSGITLILVSFITPLKIYYLTLGSISLALGALTLTPLGSGDFNSPKIFDSLKRQYCKTPQDDEGDKG